MTLRLFLLALLCSLFTAGLPAAAGACTPNDPSATFLTGIEHGRSSTVSGAPFSVGSNAGGSGGVDSGTVRSGNYSLRAAPSGGSVFRDKVVTWTPVVLERFYLRLDSLPSTDVRELAAMYSTSYSGKGQAPRYAAHLGYKASSGKLTMELNDRNRGTPVEASAPITAGDWHLVEMRYDVSAPTNRVDWRIDGVDEPQATVNGVATKINEVIWGSTFADTYTANYDDLMISQTAADYPLGEGRILGLSPNDSAGPHNNPADFRDVENGVGSPIGPLSFNAVNDVPMDHGRHIAQINNNASSYVQFGFGDTAEPCVRAVYGWVAWDPQNTKSANNGK
ncbi:MAG: hypothetical protein LC792_29825, partial [Actinobacteria bacterium]|nr:hypothetical protein [Actinomycetota bacterium]